MNNGQLIVVALGGNAISRPDEEGEVDQQFANCRRTAVALADLIAQGHELIITHGNGPQIGNFLLRNRAAAGRIYPLPMEVAVAHVQGGMGFMIATTLTNELQRRGIDRTVSALITTVLVDRDDPSFGQPNKPVGQVLSLAEVETRSVQKGWVAKEVAPGKFRRVVPSPRPTRIMEIELIRQSVAQHNLLVACGGGGIPVVRDAEKGLIGVAAVIDKDLASGLLAAKLNVDAMMILTNVERVSLDFGTPDERQVESMTLDQAKAWMEEGQFPPGSMGPKIQGAINFLQHSEKPHARVIIGPLEKATEAVAGKIGTVITKR